MKCNQWLKKVIIFMLVLTMGTASTVTASLAGESKTRIVTDTAGNKVEVPVNIKRICIVPIPWASIAYTLDKSDSRIIGIHPSAKKAYTTSIFSEMAPNLKKANSTFVDQDFNINMEELVSLKPDVVVVWDYQTKEIEQLKTMGIPAIALKYGTMEDLQNGIIVLGKVMNKEKEAVALVKYHKDSVKYFEGKATKFKNAKKPKVLYLRDGDLKVAASGSVNQKFIEMAGGINVAKDLKGQWVNVTMEQVISWNPDIIIMSNFSDFKPSDIYRNKLKGQDWSKIQAVKMKKIYKAPMGIYRWDAPCGESPLMIKWMGTIIQPSYFKDVNLVKDIKDFYKATYNYTIKDVQIDKILNKGVK